jgi:hypothetical protein
MGLVRTVTDVAAGDDGTATWADQVYNDIGSIINYRIVYTQAYAATTTFDMNNSGIQIVELTGDVTVAVSNVIDGQTFVLIFKQGGSGGYVPTWFANILWPSGSAPTLTTTVGKHDTFAFTRIGANYLASFVNFDV